MVVPAPANPKCQYLAVVNDLGATVPARFAPDAANRCLALSDPIVLSFDQQRLVCSTERHRACRRYVIASTGAAPTIAAPVRSLLLRPAVIAALVLLIAAVVVTVGYLLDGGSLVVSGLG
jgi:hypothetical protein